MLAKGCGGLSDVPLRMHVAAGRLCMRNGTVQRRRPNKMMSFNEQTTAPNCNCFLIFMYEIFFVLLYSKL